MEEQVTPQPIIRLTTGSMAAQHLMTANEVGLFEQLGEGSLTTEQLAERTKLPVRSVRVLANAMTACGLLVRDNGKYRNAQVAVTYLSGRIPDSDLRPYVRMHKLLYPGWVELEDAVRAGGGTHGHLFRGAGEEAQRTMIAGMEAMTELGAAALADAYDFRGARRVLHVGGGTGLHLALLLARYSQLQGILFDMPPMIMKGRQRLTPLVEAERAEVAEGDPFEDELPTGADVVLLTHTPHRLPPEANLSLLKRIRHSVEEGTELLLVDFWVNADHTRPTEATIAAGEFYMTLGGDVYSVGEVKGWLQQTGWSFQAHRDLNGTESLIEAKATT